MTKEFALFTRVLQAVQHLPEILHLIIELVAELQLRIAQLTEERDQQAENTHRNYVQGHAHGMAEGASRARHLFTYFLSHRLDPRYLLEALDLWQDSEAWRLARERKLVTLCKRFMDASQTEVWRADEGTSESFRLPLLTAKRLAEFMIEYAEQDGVPLR